MKNSFQIKAADVFVTCGDFTASVCRLRNTSAVSIDYKVGEVTTALAAGAASGAINVSNSTREVSVRRSDLNSSAVSVLIEWGLTADEAYELASSEVDPVAAADITDAGTAGIAVLQAGTPAQGRTALGAAKVEQLRSGRSMFSGVPVMSNVGWNTSAGPNTANSVRGNYLMGMRAELAAADIRFVFSNRQGPNESFTGGTIAGNRIAVSAGFKKKTGNYVIPLTFGGLKQVQIDPGGFVISDPIGMPISAGEIFQIRTHVQVASAGMVWPLTRQYASDGFNEAAEEGDDTLVDKSYSGTISGTKNYLFGPIATLSTAINSRGIVGLIGDSILQGVNDYFKRDGTNTVATRWGWARRIFGGYNPIHDMSILGDVITYLADPYGSARSAIMAKCDYVIIGEGTNDIASGMTLAQYQPNALAIATWFSAMGIKVYFGTIPPRTTSTDSWATLANQTVAASEAQRLAINEWLRTVPAPITGTLDVAAAVETSGKWNVGTTADGIHPNTGGYNAIATALESVRSQFA